MSYPLVRAGVGAAFALALGLAFSLGAAGPARAHADHGAPKAGNAPVASPPGARAAAQLPDARNYFTDLPLKTQDGRDVRFYSDVLAGRTVVINVIYTSCKDACPMITARLNEVRSLLGEKAAAQVHFVSISSDPERDTPKALKRFAQENKADVPNWTFLTGSKANIDHILKKLGQFNEEVTAHSTLLIAGNVPQKRWTKIRPEAPPPAVAERVRVLIDGSRESLFGAPMAPKGADKPH
jgi:cytochrome oxidase Cu insertion factor (SCO1/SenC/PrrC family)